MNTNYLEESKNVLSFLRHLNNQCNDKCKFCKIPRLPKISKDDIIAFEEATLHKHLFRCSISTSMARSMIGR